MVYFYFILFFEKVDVKSILRYLIYIEIYLCINQSKRLVNWFLLKKFSDTKISQFSD